MKNVKYWLETIPNTELRAKALANYNSDACNGAYCDDNEEVKDLKEALAQAFAWPFTPEGGRVLGKLFGYIITVPWAA